jgi:hypothetical protein
MKKIIFFAFFVIVIGMMFTSCDVAGKIIVALFERSGSSSRGQSSTAAQTPSPATNNTQPSQSQSQNNFQATHKVVTNDGTNLRLRNAPGFNTSQIGSLEYGSSVRVLDTGASAVDSDGYQGNWTYVTTLDGRTGWCFGAYLQILPQQSLPASQQPQTNNNQQSAPAVPNNSRPIIERLTYYVDGSEKTANVVYIGFLETRYSYNAGRNFIREGRYQISGEKNWSGWEPIDILKNPKGLSIDIFLGITNFYSAVEETDSRNRFIIYIWQQNNHAQYALSPFYREDGNYYYTLQKIYLRQ